MLAGFCWVWAAVCILLIIVAVVMKVDPESGIHADLRDWRDVIKAAARNVFIAAFFVACALALGVPGAARLRSLGGGDNRTVSFRPDLGLGPHIPEVFPGVANSDVVLPRLGQPEARLRRLL